MKACNEGAHKMERTEQMYTLHTQLDFSKVKVGRPTAPAGAPGLHASAPAQRPGGPGGTHCPRAHGEPLSPGRWPSV